MTDEKAPPSEEPEQPASEGPTDEAPQEPESLADTEADLDHFYGSQDPGDEKRRDGSDRRGRRHR